MSDALTKAARLKPDIRLAQAVSEFQTDLTNDQKTQYLAHQTNARRFPLDIKDVMQVTALIDRRNDGGNRCLGPRFTNFLQGVQQFAALGDVVVGGSQNIIACGVWSLVRLSLFVVLTSSAYLEKLSNLFMDIGRFAPRFQSLAALYPRSKHLHDHLCEYFIEVVRLCHDILRHSTRSAFGRMAGSLVDSGLHGYKSRLEHWAHMIRDDVNSLMAQSVESERKESSHFRTTLLQFSSRQTSRDKYREKLRILEACSIYDHQTTWKQARKAGTTRYFADGQDYQTWKASPISHTLIYTGILGSGKTVLMANMVDDLNLYAQSTRTPIAYFFCRHDIHVSLQARTVIGSLARQILSVACTSIGKGSLDRFQGPVDTDGVLRLLNANLTSDSTVYCVIDGLDECPAKERNGIIQCLKDLQITFRVLVCCSLRSQPEALSQLHYDTCSDTSTVNIPVDNPDIGPFIQTELEHRIETRKLVVGDPMLVIEIQDALTKGSQGMFLWVTLQIDVLCIMKTDDMIRHALANLPRGLFETFSRVLQMHHEYQENYRDKLLELIFAACRPLSVEELREALSVTPKDNVWNACKVINDLSAILKCCGSLITIDEEEETARFVHHSVKQFLQDRSKERCQDKFTDQADRAMGRIVITYLGYDIFDNQISLTKRPEMTFNSTPSAVISSTLSSTAATRALALKLLKSRRKTLTLDATRVLEKQLSSVPPALFFHFYEYALANWTRHGAVLVEDPELLGIFKSLLVRGVIDTDALNTKDMNLPVGFDYIKEHLVDIWRTWTTTDRPKNDVPKSLVMKASRYGHESVVKLLLETGIVEADYEYFSQATPLLEAARAGQEAVVKILLNTGIVKVDFADTNGETPLMAAATSGHDAVVRLLLDTGAVDVNHRSRLGWTPLAWAAHYGHQAVVRQLLGSSRIKADLEDRYGRTPLYFAAKEGHAGVVQQLLQTGEVSLHKPDELGRSPMWFVTTHQQLKDPSFQNRRE